MVTIAIALMIVAAFAIVAYPFFVSSREAEPPFRDADTVLENLVVQRDATYAAIKDLEFDHALGKLSDADYQSLRAKYETKAVAILRELDGLGMAQRPSAPSAVERDELIEREVQRLRRGVPQGTLTCPRCGAAHTASDAFCAKCGTALKGTRCPRCGARAAVGDQFCARCGTAIK